MSLFLKAYDTALDDGEVLVKRYVVPTGRVIATVSIKVLLVLKFLLAGLKDLSRAETYKWYQSLERVSVEE
ncbi:hypothetical protein Tco_0444587 [Tanacetum coccineum]